MGKNGTKWLAAGLAALLCCAAWPETAEAFEDEESISQNSVESTESEAEEQDRQDDAEPEMQEQIPQDSVTTEGEEREQLVQNGTEAEEQTPQDGIMPTALTLPEIRIYYQGADLTGTFDSAIDYDTYIGPAGAHDLTITVDGEDLWEGAYCIIPEPSDGVSEEELRDGFSWETASGWQIPLDGQEDGRYVAGVRAVQGDTAVYAVSEGFVLDRTAPRILTGAETEMTDGVYPAGTTFWIEDISPVEVYMNDGDTPAESVDGVYTVVPRFNSTSCTVRVRDSAGNEKSLSLTIEGGGTVVGPEDVIAESNSYLLQPDTAYTFGEGTWRTAGDPSVYPGGITFYVRTAGSYMFWKQ